MLTVKNSCSLLSSLIQWRGNNCKICCKEQANGMRLAICMATCTCTIIIIPVEGGILVVVGAKVGNSVVGAATACIYEKGSKHIALV